jgi:hypothetical protein
MAEILGIEPKRLLGFMFRNSLADPIGDGREVYGWSCKTLALRLAEAKVADSRSFIKSDATHD